MSSCNDSTYMYMYACMHVQYYQVPARESLGMSLQEVWVWVYKRPGYETTRGLGMSLQEAWV